MTRLVAEIVGLLLIAALLAALGYAYRGQSAATQVAVAQGDSARCADAAAATGAALDQVDAGLAAERERREAHAEQARSMLVDRDAEIERTQQAAHARAAHVQEAAHDDDCRALADLPVCARVAGQLWPGTRVAGDPPPGSG